MKKRIFYLLCPLFFYQCTTLQHNTANTTQLGFGVKMRVDYSGDKNTNYQISVTGAASQSVFNNRFMGFYQPTLILYQGGLGNKSTFKDINKFRFEIVNTFGGTLGYGQFDPEKLGKAFRYTPITRSLITWSASNATALYNPYAYGLTMTSNFIWSNARNADDARQIQRVGFVSIAVPYFTVGYSNDGAPFDGWRALGDAYDRYWTGRGFAQIECDFKSNKPVNQQYDRWQLTIEYDKFTGFLRDNYEAANILGLRFVPYGTESAWNKGRWSINLLNKEYNLGIIAAFYNNDRSDIQNLIHRAGRYPFHGNTYKKAWSFGFLYDMQGKLPQNP